MLDSPVRVCNAYLLDDQTRLGQWLVGAALAVALGWLTGVTIALVRQECTAESSVSGSG